MNYKNITPFKDDKPQPLTEFLQFENLVERNVINSPMGILDVFQTKGVN